MSNLFWLIAFTVTVLAAISSLIVRHDGKDAILFLLAAEFCMRQRKEPQ